MANRWYLVQTLALREFVAEANLLRQGFSTFLPRTTRTVRHARTVRTVLAAYFPGYLFVSLDLGWDPWRSINGTIGAIGIVTAAGRPLPAPDGLIAALRQAAGSEPPVAVAPPLELGATVKVLSGPFAEQVGRIHQLGGPDRVKILLDIMNGTVPVEFGRALVAPL